MSSKQVSWTIGKFKRIWTHCYVVDSKYKQDPWLGFPHCSTWSQQVSFPLTCWLRPVTSLPPILFGYLVGPLMSTYESHYTSHLTVANLVIMPLPRVSYPSSLCSSLRLALHPSQSVLSICPSATTCCVPVLAVSFDLKVCSCPSDAWPTLPPLLLHWSRA